MSLHDIIISKRDVNLYICATFLDLKRSFHTVVIASL